MENNQQKEAHKADYVQRVIKDLPLDYHDENIWQRDFAYWGGYVLQLVSVVAFAYLFYEICCFTWAVEDTSGKLLIFAFCLFAGIVIELFRRNRIKSEGERLKTYITIKASPTGYYVATGGMNVGKVLTLFVISVAMIALSAGGAWVFVQKNAPQKEQVKIKDVASPLLQDIKNEKDRVTSLDKSIQTLQQSKSAELKDHKSYVVWAGKEYLLPETKTRHEGYDRQIAQMQTQRQKHMDLIANYEGKLTKTETKVERQNEGIKTENALNLHWYGMFAAVIWVVFELALVWMICYPYIFEQEFRKEQLSEIIELGHAETYLNAIHTQKQQRAYQTLANVDAISAPTQGQLFFEAPLILNSTVSQQNPIGFQQGANSKPKSKPTDLEALYNHLLNGKPINRQRLGSYGFGVNLNQLNAMINSMYGTTHKVDDKIQDSINTYLLSKGREIATPKKKVGTLTVVK